MAIIIGVVNTIPSIFTLGEAVVTEQFPELSFAPQLSNTTEFGFGVYSYHYDAIYNRIIDIVEQSAQMCKIHEGDQINVGTQSIYPVRASYVCPYSYAIPFRAFLGAWIAYFAIYFLIRMYAGYGLASNDLRFYIAVDNFNKSKLNLIVTFLGFMLTLITLIVALLFQRLNTPSPFLTQTQPMVIFALVNIRVLISLAQSHYQNTCISDVIKEFPTPIIPYPVVTNHSISYSC